MSLVAWTVADPEGVQGFPLYIRTPFPEILDSPLVDRQTSKKGKFPPSIATDSCEVGDTYPTLDPQAPITPLRMNLSQNPETMVQCDKYFPRRWNPLQHFVGQLPEAHISGDLVTID